MKLSEKRKSETHIVMDPSSCILQRNLTLESVRHTAILYLYTAYTGRVKIQLEGCIRENTDIFPYPCN